MTTENHTTNSIADPANPGDPEAMAPVFTTRAGVDRIVLDRVRAEHGPAAIATRRTAGVSLGYPAPADPVNGIAAALAVASYARSQAYRFARQARSAGVRWRDLAEPLGLDLTDPDIAEDPGHYAFREVAGEPPQRFDTVTVG